MPSLEELMKLTYAFIHLDHSDSLQNYIQSQMDRISLFLLKEGLGQVNLSKKKKNFSIDISINTPLKYFRAQTSHFDVYTAVDQVIAKLEKQFLKVRKQNQRHKKFQLSKQGKLAQMNERFEVKYKYRNAA